MSTEVFNLSIWIYWYVEFLAVKASAVAFQIEMCKADNDQGGKKRKRADAMDEEIQVPSFEEWWEIWKVGSLGEIFKVGCVCKSGCML